MATPSDPLAPEDEALLDRVAARIVALRLETPALLTLESARPVNVIASQAMYFFEPIVLAMLRLPDYRRFARLMERRETLGLLIDRIETRAEAAQAERQAEKAARRAAKQAGR